MKSTINELISIVGKGDFYKVLFYASGFAMWAIWILSLRVR